MSIRHIAAVIGSGAVVAFALVVPMAAAQQAGQNPSQSALAVSPAIMEHVLERGKATPFTVQVSNVTNFPLPIKAMVRSFTVQSAELEKTERARLDASSWFAIEEPDFILQPNQVRTVKGVIKPPADATPGGHYATVFFQPLVPQEVLSPSTAYLNSQVGVLTFLIVKGDVTKSATLSNPLQAPGLVRGGPIDFTFSIRNTGNVHIMPTGRVAIYGRDGAQVASVELPEGAILPDAAKDYTLTWDAAVALGNYRAELEVTYGEGDAKLPAASVRLWVVPWVEIIAAAAGGGIVVFITIKTRHRWGRAWRILRGKDPRFH